VYIFTSNPKLLTQLSLYSGVEVISSERMPENHEGNLVDAARDFLIAEGKLEKGDKFINTLSVPLQADNRTNTVRLSVVD
jgi:pyruvate kinase